VSDKSTEEQNRHELTMRAAVSLRVCLVAAVLVGGARTRAQTNPLAAISGHVTDASGASIAGVTVAATSPALQGSREGATTSSGDFLLPFLPPGEYEFAFRRAGFLEARVRRALRVGETAIVDVKLELEGRSEAITVGGAPASSVSEASVVSATYPSPLLERLPNDRTPRAAVLLTPSAGATGPSGSVMIAGAMAYENLYLVDGVVVKDLVLGQPRPFPVEDAVEETDVAAVGISAEHGRFTGGVVNVVTRSGGNELAGSLRVTLQSDAWRALTPYERESLAEDPRESSVVPTYEGALGGPLLRDRLWYFLAGRWQETSRAATLAYTNVPYNYHSRESRLEAKVTAAPFAGDSLRVAYGRIDTREENHADAAVMDLASLGSLKTPEDLLSVHDSVVIGSRIFLEGQFSRRTQTPTGRGARTTDLIAGTVIRDGARDGAPVFHSPVFCGVCGVPPGDLREEEQEDRGYVLKASGFLSGPRIGAHDVVVGAEVADELRRSDSFQSGSGFLVTAGATRIVNGAVFPVFAPDGRTFIEWRPIDELSRGSRFRTTSIYVNDRWRLGGRWSFNLGLRWDRDDSRDQSGATVGASDALSPRLAAAFDPKGDGALSIEAGFARYVASLSFSIGDIGTAAGRPARYVYTYGGPAVNAGGSELVSADAALATLFDWFEANGGTSQPLSQAPAIPGLNRRVAEDLELPRTDELTLGVTRRFGNRASVRVAGVRRSYSRQYSERADLSTGRVVDPRSGRAFDLRLVGNSDLVERTYEALLAQWDLRLGSELRAGGSYTLSRTLGNFDGDNALPEVGGATAESDLNFFPEYGDSRWRAPSGPLRSDQSHRARVWAIYDVPLASRFGHLSFSALERVDSGQAWNVVGQVDTRPYVMNPGYVGPPARVPYFFEPRGSRRTETATATDLALLYGLPVAALKSGELFARVVVTNVFGESAQVRPGNTTVLTAANDRRFAAFDPFTEKPVRGVHWDYAPGFGRALSADDTQQPRTLGLSVGARF
jgi:hypothetical protein